MLAGLSIRDIVLMNTVMVVKPDRDIPLRPLLPNDIFIEPRDNLARV